MAIDSAGYNTSALFQAKSYNPNALATGLQSAAAYDPSQQSTTQPTSSARYLQQTNSPNILPQDTASASQNLASTPSTAATQGLTAANNNSIYPSYQSNIKLGGVAGVTYNGQGDQLANQATSNRSYGSIGDRMTQTQTTANAAQVAAATPYGGPQIVGIKRSGIWTDYYQWDAASGSYIYRGVYANGAKTPFDTSNTQYLANVQGTVGSDNGTSFVNQQLSTSIADFNKRKQEAAANLAATNSTAAASTQYGDTLAYLQAHGSLSSSDDAFLNRSLNVGNDPTYQARKDAIAKAQADYQAAQAQASVLTGLQLNKIDTSATDEASAAAMRSLASQQASANYGADSFASRFGNFDAATLSGQNAINHDKAAAAAYNQNLGLFANALSTQANYDQQYTGNMLNANIQGVQQTAVELQNELQYLSGTARNQAQQQIDQLNAALSAYQQAVAQYGQNSAQAMALAKGILTGGASLAATVTAQSGSKSGSST